MTQEYPAGLSYGPETRIVLIGTSKCEKDDSMLQPLPQVLNNVRELKKFFLDPNFVGLPEHCIVPVVDEAHSSEIATRVHIAADEATDTLLVYYSGHGLYGDEFSPLYLTSTGTISGIKNSAIDIQVIKRTLQQSRANKRILILDCCYSGRAFADGMADTRDGYKVAIDLAGTYGIAAVPGDFKALAPEGATLTSFTESLLLILRNGVANGRPTMTIDEVFVAVKRDIAHKAKAQQPERSNRLDGGDFRIARNLCDFQASEEKDTAPTKPIPPIHVHLNYQSTFKVTYSAAERLERYTSSEEFKEASLEPIKYPLLGMTFAVNFIICIILSLLAFKVYPDEFSRDAPGWSIAKMFAAILLGFGAFGAFIIPFGELVESTESIRIPAIILKKSKHKTFDNFGCDLDLLIEDGTTRSVSAPEELFEALRVNAIGLAVIAGKKKLIQFHEYGEF